jgi:hypothetical protein
MTAFPNRSRRFHSPPCVGVLETSLVVYHMDHGGAPIGGERMLDHSPDIATRYGAAARW